MIFDESLSFRQHIKEISKSSIYKLRNLHYIRNHFSRQNFEILIHAFVSTKVDYCNSLFAGIHKCDLRPLQLVQNYAARLVLKRTKYEHSRPLLHELHWLPISRRIDFKILLLTYKAINSLAPEYISALLFPANRPNFLRCANDNSLLHIESTTHSTKRMGDRAFSLYAPHIWNNIPKNIREAKSVNIFKSQLKTYLFNLEFQRFN